MIEEFRDEKWMEGFNLEEAERFLVGKGYLDSIFVWRLTPEGDDYWSKACDEGIKVEHLQRVMEMVKKYVGEGLSGAS